MLDRTVYLGKPVTFKKKTGEANFLQLARCLSFDLRSFASKEEYIVFYTAIAMNLYMHNSSHIPVAGFGKAQKRELEHPLYYFRSQTNHGHRVFFDKITKTKKEKRSLLPRNSAHQKLVLEYMPDLKKLDERGFANGEMKKRYGEFLASSGVRANNFTIYKKALAIVTHEKNSPATAVQQKLKKYIKKVPKKDKSPKEQEVLNEINSGFKKFKELQKLTQSYEAKKNLHQKMTEERNKNAQKIKECSEEFKFEHIEVTTENGLVFVRFYPEFKRNIDSRNYKEGVTNVLISFLGGLLNHHAKRRGLFLHTDRRQSFGFVRPTITDVGAMHARLSLGLVPASYNEVVTDSLRDFDVILKKFDFRKKDHLLLKKYFEPCEKSQAKDKKSTKNTGNHFLSSMRSDKDKWQAVNAAQFYLDETSQAMPDYLSSSFVKFLDVVVYEKNGNKTPQALSVVKELKNENNDSETLILFTLVRNLVKVVVDYVGQLKPLDNNDRILHLKNSYLHSLKKLFNNCDKSIALLNSLNQYEVTHLCAKAHLLIENMMEYLISLDALEQIRRDGIEDQSNPIQELVTTECNYAVSMLGLNKNQSAVYFTDSGQQAITTSLLALNMQCFAIEAKKGYTDKPIYVCDGSYFELNSFLDKIGSLKTADKNSARIIFIDIAKLSQFKSIEFPKIQAVVIDITNNPNLSNSTLKNFVNDFLNKNVYVFLASSSLKHEELFLDKYQSGKIIALVPQGKPLNLDVVDTLRSISNEAIDPAIASFLQMVNHVFQDKILVSAPKKSASFSVASIGVFGKQKEEKKVATQAKGVRL